MAIAAEFIHFFMYDPPRTKTLKQSCCNCLAEVADDSHSSSSVVSTHACIRTLSARPLSPRQLPPSFAPAALSPRWPTGQGEGVPEAVIIRPAWQREMRSRQASP